MKKLIALIVTIFGAFLMELPDPVPLLDESLVMIVILRLWGWAGVDLTRIFSGKSRSRDADQIIEID